MTHGRKIKLAGDLERNALVLALAQFVGPDCIRDATPEEIAAFLERERTGTEDDDAEEATVAAEEHGHDHRPKLVEDAQDADEEDEAEEHDHAECIRLALDFDALKGELAYDTRFEQSEDGTVYLSIVAAPVTG